MGVIDIGISGGLRPCSMRLDLDAARRNENTILSYISSSRFYEPDVSRVLLRVLREGDTFIDVGANAGFFTMLASALVGPTGRVLSFEPDPDNNARLRQNILLNGFGHVTVVDQPAMASAADLDFYLNCDDSGGSAAWNVADFPTNVRSREAPNVLSLRSTTLDFEMARLDLRKVRALKIDTEGADHSVVKGAANLLAGCGVPFVICELNEFGLDKMGSGPDMLRADMAALGYDSFMLFNDGRLPHLIPPETVIRQNCIGNILFSTRDAVGSCWRHYAHDAGEL